MRAGTNITLTTASALSLLCLGCLGQDEPAAQEALAPETEIAATQGEARQQAGPADGEGRTETTPMPEAPAEAFADMAEAEAATEEVDDMLAGALRGGGSAMSASASPMRRRVRPRPGTSGGASGAGGYGGLAAARPAPMPQALPQNGVLASNFVGGNGVRARLDDLLDRGVMVGGELVRIEAFGDREPLPYPVPSRDGVDMFAELERSQLTTGRERVHLQVALIGRQGEMPARPHMDIRLVLDRSGSMQDGSKWQHALQAAHDIVDALEPGDTFGLISYSDEATLDVRPARVGNGRAAHAAIRRLVPGGGTNIGAALELADQHAPRARAGGTVGMTFLVSDGRVTVGQTNGQMLASIARRTFDRGGVLTTAIGLGTDFDEQTMIQIAREGSGSYHFVRRPEDMSAILEDELEARAQAVAQGLRVRVELADGVVARQVYGSRLLSEQEHAAVRATEVAVDRRIARELGVTRTRQQEEERGLRIHLPTFRRGDQHVILMELDVPAGTDTTRIANVTLDYKDLVRRRNGTVRRTVSAERITDAARAQASVVRPVKRTVLAFQAGAALQDAAEALGRGDAATARRSLGERRELLEAAAELWRDEGLRQDAQMLARYERVVNGAWGGWDSGSRDTLVMAMNYFGDQRMR